MTLFHNMFTNDCMPPSTNNTKCYITGTNSDLVNKHITDIETNWADVLNTAEQTTMTNIFRNAIL